MSDFTVPTDFIVIGGDHDATGSSQIRPRKTIGGGGTSDGLDESDAILRNSRWCWTQGNRVNLFEAFGYGERGDITQAPLYTVTSASYVEVWEVPVVLATSRLSFTCTIDFKQSQVKLEFFSSGDVSRGSVETTAVTSQEQQDATLTASSTDVAYLKISVKKNATDGEVYGIRVYEDASTI